MEGNLLYSKPIYLYVNLIQKNTFFEASRIMCNQISEHLGPTKSTHKITHHKKVIYDEIQSDKEKILWV